MVSRNLLVLAPVFPDELDERIGGIFVKEQLKHIKDYFDCVYVIVPTTIWNEYLVKDHYDDYSWDNVKVYYPMTVNFPFPYVPKYLKNLWIHLETYEILKFIKSININFDLIHAHYTWYSGALAIELNKEFKAPVVITEHTSLTFNKAIREKDPAFVRSWMLCDGIIRVRRSDIPLFESVGIPSEKIYCIPNGYDDKKFIKLDTMKCRKELNLPLDKKIVLNVANLYDDVKGHKYLIDAMNIVSKHRSDVLCVIVGHGKLKNELEHQIKVSKLDEYVYLVGSKAHHEIPMWMNACDVFVLPSLNEGNPTVMFECLGCGKPFIGTTVGGMPEIIISEDYGSLVKPGDSKKLAEVILNGLNKEWCGARIQDYARKYTWEYISKNINNVYINILGRE